MNKQSLLTKLILFGCVLCIVPVLLLGMLSYMESSSSIQHQVNQSNTLIMKQMKGNIEQVLKTLDYTLNHMADSTLMQDALFRQMDYNDFQLYNSLRREFGHIQSFDMKVTDVLLLNAADKWLINNNGLYELNKFKETEHLLSFMNLPNNSSWILHENSNLGSPDTQSNKCSHTVILVKKLPLLLSDKRGILFAPIPVCSLASMMESDSTARHFMIMDQNHTIMVHPDETLIGKSIMETGYINENELTHFANNSEQFETNTTTGSYSVTYVKSDLNNWIYVSFTEMSQFTKESRAIGWFTLYACLLILAVCVIFVWYGSRNMYNPMRRILQAISEGLPEWDAVKRNEFQVIQEHIQQLFASNSNLKVEINRHSQQVRSFFLINMYQDNVVKTEIEDRLRAYGYAELIDGWDQMIVLTLQIDSLEETRFTANDLDLLMFAINNIVEEIVPAENRLTPVIFDQTQVTLIGFKGSQTGSFKDRVYQFTESIQQNIRTYLGLSISIGLSLPFDSASKSARAYREGLEALMQRLKLGQGIVVPYENLNSGKHTLIYTYPKQLENELIESIKLADEDKSYALLKQWLVQVLGKDQTPQLYQISLIRLLNDLMIVSQESGIALVQIHHEGRSMHEELLQLYISGEIESWFRTRILQPMLQVFRDRGDSQYHNLSEQIISMIHSEYDTELTLDECALRLHYNAFYLSSVFKKETDMTFSDYLLMYRFQMARKWLIETDMPIKDIAQKLQYNNPQNFIRSFRKQEEMTPGQYRSKYGNIKG
ncbi:helix-turn-helix domain-containing protein [Paenibacillus sp. FSL H7-0331]|uniref:helix-turn-helix domain-containing protein n=1 Tax=Paenibacillus sp. FSL H7-0331 TaxID=1920421 RepID=UPI00096C6EDC|nr:helix-turn-helix domain-containing protein [Paenibacillus sp. FSL H7-0331]OMF20853.1 AraC family transcriptional regulator [Paenibacillus sp. FSL H7-0331]